MKCPECGHEVEVKTTTKKSRVWTCKKAKGGCGAYGGLPGAGKAKDKNQTGEQPPEPETSSSADGDNDDQPVPTGAKGRTIGDWFFGRE